MDQVSSHGRAGVRDFSREDINFGATQLAPFVTGWMGSAGRLLFYDASGVIVGPGTTETDATTYTLPANTVVAPSALEFNLTVYSTNSTGGTKDSTIAIYIGSTKILSCATSVPDPRVSHPTYIRAILFTQPSFNRVIGYSFDISAADENTSFPATKQGYNAAAYAAKQAAIDFTVANTIKVTLKNANATNQLTTLGEFSINLFKQQS